MIIPIFPKDLKVMSKGPSASLGPLTFILDDALISQQSIQVVKKSLQ